jgi:hypothetical protein
MSSAPAEPQLTLPTSDYIVFVDESGDHGMRNMGDANALFVLAAVLFKKDDYVFTATPQIAAFKFRHFGHDAAVLHSREIRKREPPFQFLLNAEKREVFLADLTATLAAIPFQIVATIIDKRRLEAAYAVPDNPYELALKFCLERIDLELEGRVPAGSTTCFVCESRGKNEDRDLEVAFRRICDGDNHGRRKLAFDVVFSRKVENVPGIQIADLVAYPIGRRHLTPDRDDPATALVLKKLRRSPWGDRAEGFGVKVFP